MVTGDDSRTGGRLVVPRIDLAEAYAAVRRRGLALRRRRIISSVLAAVVLSSVFSIVGVYYVSSVPLPDALGLPATTTVYYSDGRTVLARLGSHSRVLVDLDTLPSHVPGAVIAAEDPGFWLDSGTLISRQYARAATGVTSPAAAGEARLLVMSWKLEDSFDKRQILGFYVNTVYFGRGAYGIEAAARAYFGKHAAALTVAEAVVLAGLVASPGDGRFDPTVDPVAARRRFAEVADRMVVTGVLPAEQAALLRLPKVHPYDPGVLESDLDRPTGLVVSHVLAELRQSPPFRDKPAGFLENGGYAIVTTIDAGAQRLLESLADETVSGSLMYGQPGNLQAAAVVMEPGTGRVVAYYGGHNGTGADYAGWYVTADGTAAGYGAHPPGQTFHVYALAAALSAGISVRSVWQAPQSRQFPASGRFAGNPVTDFGPVPCQPACTLAEVTTASRNVPYFALTERLGPAAVIDTARAAGIGSMWLPPAGATAGGRYDLRGDPAPVAGMTVPAGAPGLAVPLPFGTDVALGGYPVTVVDQAAAMATFAAGGRRGQAHYVRKVTKDAAVVLGEHVAESTQVLAPSVVADLTWTLAQNPAGALPGGRPSATKTGVGLLRTSQVETAHAWIVGFTPVLAMAVWVGNEEAELPLRDAQGARVTGAGLPAAIYRAYMARAPDLLPTTTAADTSAQGSTAAGAPSTDVRVRARLPFPDPPLTGSTTAGDASPSR